MMMTRLLPTLLLALPLSAAGSEIQYETVKEALDDVRDQPGAVQMEQGDWNVFSNSEDDKRVLWSFAQPSHYAYPSLARREVIEENGEPIIDTTLLCEASKEACHQLFLDFRDLDESLTKRMQDAN